MTSKLLITLAIVLVLTHEYVPVTMSQKTPSDPKDAEALEDAVQGETFRLNRNCSCSRISTLECLFPFLSAYFFVARILHTLCYSLRDCLVMLFDDARQHKLGILQLQAPASLRRRDGLLPHGPYHVRRLLILTVLPQSTRDR